MAFSIYAIDNEFAVATGSNIGTSVGKSRFDNPPNGSKDLVITTHDGDDDPRLFEPGDVYDVSWGGAGGGSIMNAVVMRSDPSPTVSGGVIVFKGTDENGDPAEVVWTPGVDLENWYWTNYNPSAEPQFYTADQNSGYSHEFVCFEKTVRLHTPLGLRRAGSLEVGDKVCTWAGPAATVQWIGRRTVEAMGKSAPVRFSRGAIGNFAPIKLSPQHRVLITSPKAEDKHGSREVLVPAIALVDEAKIRRVPRKQVTYVHILLDRHDILIAAGAPCESLLPGRRVMECLPPEDRAAVRKIIGEKGLTPCRPVLSVREAMELISGRGLPKREAALI
ncbi:Hint domain-containing protein [Tropicibacter oceani]|uniref:Hint domain-containing protein n=1 Tax=Tropicibacter oceani TaxID=3058420 RepID=A0ABY8QI95_9RHOB|nr:Hint domain-containing protein [Tropicibacter oceani]WGW03872.1 Hint domain-containing protein [Tropicibacter oceani]